jgi:2'-5' RNA ligase superfamily
MGFSAIVIPVAELEFMVRLRLGRISPEYLFDDPLSTQAHITLLGPFVDHPDINDELIRRLTAFFSYVVPFTFSMGGLRTRAGKTVCLEPDPPDPFRALTRALWRDYPAYPPYGGSNIDVGPHLTLDYEPEPAALREIAGELEPLLPIRVRAAAANLNWYEPHKSMVMASFSFGG